MYQVGDMPASIFLEKVIRRLVLSVWAPLHRGLSIRVIPNSYAEGVKDRLSPRRSPPLPASSKDQVVIR